MIQGNNLAQRLFEVLTENGGIAPAWQVQTQLLDQGAGQGEIAAQLGAGAGGHAYHGNQAYAIEGNATESADFKTQSFGDGHRDALRATTLQPGTKRLRYTQMQEADAKGKLRPDHETAATTSANETQWRRAA